MEENQKNELEDDIRVEDISLEEDLEDDEEEEEDAGSGRKIFGIVGTVVAALCVVAAVFMVIRYTNAFDKLTKKEPETTISAADHLQAAKDFEKAGEYGKAISAYQWYLKTETADIALLLCMRADYQKLNLMSDVEDCNNQILELSKTATLTDEEHAEVLALYYRTADEYFKTDYLKTYKYLTEEVPLSDALDLYAHKDEIIPKEHPLAANGLQADGTVFFGLYPAEEVYGSELSEYIVNGDYNEKQILDLYGTKYYREEIDEEYHYFILDNLQWNILKDENDTYLLQTTKIVDAQPFHDELVNITWDDSTLRTYMNTTFLDRALNEEERLAVLTMTNEPCGNPTYNLQKEGAVVTDQACVLSVAQLYERYNKDFHAHMKEHHEDYRALTTGYAEAKGVLPDENGYGKWWIRTMGVDSTRKMAAGANGNFSTDGYDVNYDGAGVRAAILVSKDAIQ